MHSDDAGAFELSYRVFGNRGIYRFPDVFVQRNDLWGFIEQVEEAVISADPVNGSARAGSYPHSSAVRISRYRPASGTGSSLFGNRHISPVRTRHRVLRHALLRTWGLGTGRSIGGRAAGGSARLEPLFS